MNRPELERVDGRPVAHMQDDIDAANSNIVLEQLAELLGEDTSSLIVDLSDVRYIDSAGLDMLMRLGSRLEHRRAQLILVIPQESHLSRLARIVGLYEVIAIEPTVAAALALGA